MMKFVEDSKDSICVSKEIPLISNLSMSENISLIKEVHSLIPINLAKQEAIDILKRIKLEYIADKRLIECKSLPVFYTMFIRASMMDKSKIIIVSPSELVENIEEMNEIINNLYILNQNKRVLIVDIEKNRLQYQGCLCIIVK